MSVSEIIADQSIFSRLIALTAQQSHVDAQETTTSASYTNLATSGPSVTLSPGVTQDHHIIVSTELWHSSTNSNTYNSVDIAGAGAADVDAAYTFGTIGQRSARQMIAADKASGSTHTSKYRTASGTGNWVVRRLTAFAA